MTREQWESDFELVKNAIYIQPNEQGMWQYYYWLLNLAQPFGVTKVEAEERGEDLELSFNFNQKVSSVYGNLQINSGKGE